MSVWAVIIVFTVTGERLLRPYLYTACVGPSGEWLGLNPLQRIHAHQPGCRKRAQT